MMDDGVKLIYFYKLGADGFRSGDIMEHPNFFYTITDAIRSSSKSGHWNRRHPTIDGMAEIMLDYLKRSSV